MRSSFLFIARALFSLTFFISGGHALFNWSDTVTNFNKALDQWHIYSESFVYMNDILLYCISYAQLLIGIAICLEIMGGLCILLNYHIRLGSLFLLLIFLLETIVYHPFWLEIGENVYVQATLFFKHLSIIGALLYFLIKPRDIKDDVL